MEVIEDYSSVNSKEAKVHKMSENYKASHRELRDAFKKLGSWRKESQRELSNISIGIEKGIGEIIEEVCGLESQLSIITKENNDLIETVHGLNMEVKRLTSELSHTQSLLNPAESHNLDMIEEDSHKNGAPDTDPLVVETSEIGSTSGEEENHAEEESNERNEFNDSTCEAIKSEQVEPEGMEQDGIDRISDVICQDCKCVFSTWLWT